MDRTAWILLLALFFCVIAQDALGYELSDEETTDPDFRRGTSDLEETTTHFHSAPYLMLRDSFPRNDRDPTASEFRIIGGESMSRPCCVSWGPGRVDCFIRGPVSTVLHLAIENGAYGEWEDLGGVVMNSIECVSTGEGHLDVLVIGEDHELHTKTYTGEWSDWETRGFSMDVPSCAARAETKINCMTRGSNNLAWHIDSQDGVWGSWDIVLGTPVSPIGCTTRSPTNFDCFACQSDNHLYEKYFEREGSWRGWRLVGDLDVTVKGKPSATSWGKDRIDVFVLGLENDVKQLTWEGAYLPYASLGGPFESVPTCLTTGVGKIHCFGIGQNSFLYRNSFEENEWKGWVSSNGAFLDTPSCVVSNENEVSCYMRAFNRAIIEAVYTFE